mgnify:FL=1
MFFLQEEWKRGVKEKCRDKRFFISTLSPPYQGGGWKPGDWKDNILDDLQEKLKNNLTFKYFM